MRRSRYLYLTHSHLDHFHWPSLRRLGPHRVLHPAFPNYAIPGFLDFAWLPQPDAGAADLVCAERPSARRAACRCRSTIRSCLSDTPKAVIFNINDAAPRRALLERIRQHLQSERERPRSRSRATRRRPPARSPSQNGVRTPAQDRKRISSRSPSTFPMRSAPNTSCHSLRKPFSIARISKWANDHKVTYEDLKALLVRHQDRLCASPLSPWICKSFAWTSAYDAVKRSLTEAQIKRVHEEEGAGKILRLARGRHRQAEELHGRALFRALDIPQGHRLAADDERARAVLPDASTRTIENKIPDDYDFVISLPDKVHRRRFDQRHISPISASRCSCASIPRIN